MISSRQYLLTPFWLTIATLFFPFSPNTTNLYAIFVALQLGTLLILIRPYGSSNELQALNKSRLGSALQLLIISFLLPMFVMSIYRYFRYGYNDILADFVDLHRPILFSLIFIYFFRLCQITRGGLLGYVFNFMSYLCIMLAFIRILGFPPPSVLSLYAKDIVASYRLTFPFLNPYDLAIISAISFAYSFFMLFFSCKNKSVLIYILSLFSSLYLLVLTQSPSGFLAAAILVFVLLIRKCICPFLYAAYRRLRIKKSLIFPILIVLIIAFTGLAILAIFIRDFAAEFDSFLSNYSRLAWVVDSVSAGEVPRSGEIRLEQYNFFWTPLENDYMFFLFGHGISKDLAGRQETEYLFTLFRSGVLGLFAFMIAPYLLTLRMFSLRYTNLMRFSKRSGRPSASQLSLDFSFTLFLAYPFIGMFNAYSQHPKVSFLFFALFGTVISFLLLRPSANRCAVLTDDSILLSPK
jgi:hypothetical protein